MPRRGDNIHKRKDGRWEGRYKNGYKNDGTVKYSSVYGTTYSECKHKLEKAKTQPPSTKVTTSNLKFSDALSLWMESNRVRLKGATQTKYQNMIDTHIIPSLGGLKISQINSMYINTFLDEKINSGGIKSNDGLSASYVKTMAIIIEATIKFAVAEGWCAPLKTPIHKPTICKSEPTVLSKDTEKKLLRILLCEQSGVSIGTLMALNTGMRIGEVCALKWDDVDFQNNIIHIRHTISRVGDESSEQKTKLILDSPKTLSSQRDLPISDTLRRVLVTAYKNRNSMFVVSNNANFVGTRTFDYQYRNMLKSYNLPVVNFHTLRHTFATRCAELGMDAKTLSQLLGHATANISLNVYVHPSIDAMKQQINLLYGSA